MATKKCNGVSRTVSLAVYDENAFDELVGGLLRMSLDSIATEDDRVNRVAAHWACVMASGASAAVFRYGESPIERLFLGALVTGLISTSPLGYAFVEPSNDALTVIRELHNEISGMALVDRTMGAKAGSKDGYWLQASKIQRERYLRYMGLDFKSALHLMPQAVLRGMGPNGGNARADLLAFIPDVQSFLVVIECDGFSWHGTKQGFTSDRARDRAMLMEGIDVIRFSGAEINADPMQCASDALHQLDALEYRRGGAERTDA